MPSKSTLITLALLALTACSPMVRAADPQLEAPGFPASWVGTWKGPATIVAPGRPNHDFLMELIVAPTDDPARYRWTIIYAEINGARQERAYELIVRDADKGRYAVDEKNGIVIPSTLLDGALYSSFEVQGTRVNTRTKLEGAGNPDERISVEMTSGSAADAEASGGNDNIPEVRSVLPRTLQKAALRRVPEAPANP